MPGILFDTSVYISALRQGDETILSLRRAARSHDQKTRPLWLSAVVLHELYIGAEGQQFDKVLSVMEISLLGNTDEEGGELLRGACEGVTL